MSNHPSDVRPLIQEGLSLLNEEKWEAALAPLQKAIELDPNHPAPHFFSALAFLAAGQSDKAEAAINQGMARSPENALGKNLQAVLKLGEGRVEDALRVLKEAGVVESALPQALLLLEIEKALAAR